MKWFLCCLLVLNCTLANAEERGKSFTAQWLHRGCALVSMAYGNNGMKGIDADGKNDVLSVSNYLNGFLEGATVATLAEDGNEITTSRFGAYPREWKNPRVVAESVLAFMEENQKDIRDSMECAYVLKAWYVANHPSATGKQRRIALSMMKIIAAEKP